MTYSLPGKSFSRRRNEWFADNKLVGRGLRYMKVCYCSFLLLPEFGPFLSDEEAKETNSIFLVLLNTL